ncbi:MAG: hypothetical protein IJR86_00875 [Bacteroidaceae bacterium]|nr:hypothetical protein [Bacteroidaceae bacterium]
MKKKSTSLGLVIPEKLSFGGMTFYKRHGRVIGRVSNSKEMHSNTLAQFKQRQRMRHTIALWKMLRFCETMFTERGNAYQNFASLANRLPVLYIERIRMEQASFLMPDIPVSDGTLPTVGERLGEVDGVAALITDLSCDEHPFHEKLWLYTAEQKMENGLPRVRFYKRDVSRSDMVVVDGHLALVGDEYADDMKGWALVRIIDNRCSSQTIVTRCTLYRQYTTEEALEAAAKSYGGLTETLVM